MKTVHVPREVIDSKLLAALDDKSKVAILADREDLGRLISALTFTPDSWGMEFKILRDDLRQLDEAAFGPKGSGA